MLDVKKWIEKVSGLLSSPPVVGVNFQQTITSKTSGMKTASGTINIPQGYAVVPNCRPVSAFISGDARVSVTDRGDVNVNGSNISFSYYLYNPNSSTANLLMIATILCYRVG